MYVPVFLLVHAMMSVVVTLNWLVLVTLSVHVISNVLLYQELLILVHVINSVAVFQIVLAILNVLATLYVVVTLMFVIV